MVMENVFMKTRMYMKVNGRMICLMGRESILIGIKNCHKINSYKVTRVNGKMDLSMGRGCTFKLMV